MNDKEILAEVYKMCCNPFGPLDGTKRKRHPWPFETCDIKSFIEEEWQKRDEQELVDQHNRNRKAKDHVSSADEIRNARPDGLYARGDDWYSSDPCTTDVKEIERHRGLEIGKDGTVKKIL